MTQTKRRSVLGLVFLTVFIDLAGFSVIFPLFPAMLDHYLQVEGPDSLIGKLARALERFAGGDPDRVVTLFGGILGSLYSLLQFVFAPIWGGLSDRIGRRPTLLVTLSGTMVSYALWFLAGSFGLLVCARMLGGIMAGNIATANAVIGDTTEARERAKGMSVVGMGIGLGFILGPVLGGLAASFDLSSSWEAGRRLGVNPFSVAAGAAFALSVVNLLWVAARYPETLPPEKRGAQPARHGFDPLKRLKSFAPGVQRTSLVFFCYLLAFSGMEFTLTFLAKDRLGWTPKENTYMFVFVGLTMALVQGGLVRRLAPALGERRLALIGLTLVVPGFVLVGLSHSAGLLYAGLFCMATGSALAMPSMTALVSRYAPPERQGLALGSYQSAGALSRALGPLIGGLLYWKFGSTAPYLCGAVFLLLPILLAAGLPPVPGSQTQ